MSIKAYYSYIRVSTVKQGQTGTSLEEQRGAIERFAARHSLKIVKEYAEQETAAKGGRPVFALMLKALRQGKAQGVIIHKIDRSARNLRDWAELGELIDSGIEVQFANENLDLHSRGGRLSADIQAVVAADYIRNLREEVIKGFYGRIKQGLLPRPAPIGYLDCGQGKAKAIDPVMGPLVQQMFQLYASGRYSIRDLTEHMYGLGLRNRQGGKLLMPSIAKCLHNPFYMGVIRIMRRNELYPGAHSPLVAKAVFDKVQEILSGKAVKGSGKHDFLFRKMLRCAACHTTLIGEEKKGHVYYRCHTKTCPEKTIREEIVEDYVMEAFKTIRFTDKETRFFRHKITAMYETNQSFAEAQNKALKLQQEQVRVRLSKLTDAYLDGTIEQPIYLDKKNGYVVEEQEIKERMAAINQNLPHIREQIEQFLELVNNAYLSYKLANSREKQELAKIATSNLIVKDKKVLVKLRFPFELLVAPRKRSGGGPHRETGRISDVIFAQLVEYFSCRKDCGAVST